MTGQARIPTGTSPHAQPASGFDILDGAAERRLIRLARERAANLVCLILVGAIATMALPLIQGGDALRAVLGAG